MTVMDLVLATRNKGKLKEIKEILKPLNLILHTYDEYMDIKKIKETGKTFEENAILKATFIAKQTKMVTLADDSGLEVDCLSGQPGIYSARFAGEHATDMMNNEKLLSLMADVPLDSRQGRFVCAIAIALPDRLVGTVRGVCEGHIGFELRGGGGFGYDPLFVVTSYNVTFAELSLDIKNKISHRAKALNKALIVLDKLLLNQSDAQNTHKA